MKKQWIITASLSEYKIFDAADELESIWWTASKVTKNIEIDDIVYIYVGKPYSKIMYKFVCTDIKKQADKYFGKDDLIYWEHPELYVPGVYDYFKIKRLQYINDDNLSLKKLNELGLVKTHIQGSYKSDNHPELFKYIEKQFLKYIQIADNVQYKIEVNSDGKIKKMEDIPIKPSIYKQGKISKSYNRNPQIGRYAIKKAEYKCEVNNSHMTFICRGTGKPYLESHHLIPISAQKKFENSLDVPANIIALCSSCHNEIHYGENSKQLIIKLYDLRKDRLRKAGIVIKLQELLNLYNFN